MIPKTWYESEERMIKAIAHSPLQTLKSLDLIAYLGHQRIWSARTFGPGPRTLGIVKHIQKELVEIQGAPSDLYEWIDVVILALDGAWRAGFTPKQVVEALVEKQRINFRRKWPPPGPEDAPAEHVHEAAEAGGES